MNTSHHLAIALRSNIVVATGAASDTWQRDNVVSTLADRNVSIALTMESDCALIEAHVSLAKAARMLAPLGRHAIGRFWTMPDGSVVIDAPVSPSMARKMLAAGCAVA